MITRKKEESKQEFEDRLHKEICNCTEKMCLRRSIIIGWLKYEYK